MRAFVLALALALAACATDAPTRIQLSATNWTMVDDAASPHFPTIAFLDARVYGFDGCNSWFGAVDQTGNQLRFSHVGPQHPVCDGEPGRGVERRFLAALDATRYARYDQTVLVLLDDHRREVARFNNDAAPPGS